jgi:hypothetical protein
MKPNKHIQPIANDPADLSVEPVEKVHFDG